MKARLGTKEVGFKPGDKVSVYSTRKCNVYTMNIDSHGQLTSTVSSTTAFCGVGVVVRVYKHIDAMVVRFRKRAQFIKQNDLRYSVWKAS